MPLHSAFCILHSAFCILSSLVRRRINVANGDALAEEVDAAAGVLALEISEAGGGVADRVVALPGVLLEEAEFHFHGGGNGVARRSRGRTSCPGKRGSAPPGSGRTRL